METLLLYKAKSVTSAALCSHIRQWDYTYNLLQAQNYLYEADQVKLIISNIPTALLNSLGTN